MKILPQVLLLQLFIGLTCLAAEKNEPVKAELFRPRAGLNNIFAKLASGQMTRIAYFGGSISECPFGWRVQTFKWFKSTFPKARIEEIYAAKGGRGSDDGLSRMDTDVLAKKPDLIFVEFAVNDGSQPSAQVYSTMEGIVRKAWTADPNIDICFLYTWHRDFSGDYSKGVCPRSTGIHDRVAEHYGIPAINVALKAVQLEHEGKIVLYEPKKGADGKDVPLPPGAILFTPDGCHPTEQGHEIYTALIEDCIKQLGQKPKPGPHVMPAAMASQEHK